MGQLNIPDAALAWLENSQGRRYGYQLSHSRGHSRMVGAGLATIDE